MNVSPVLGAYVRTGPMLVPSAVVEAPSLRSVRPGDHRRCITITIITTIIIYTNNSITIIIIIIIIVIIIISIMICAIVCKLSRLSTSLSARLTSRSAQSPY